jgi:hypothetical protein
VTAAHVFFFLSLFCVLGILIGCAGSDTVATPKDGGMTLSDVKDQMRPVPALLLKFGSNDPAEWRKAYMELKSLDEALVSSELVKMAKQALDPQNPAAKQTRQTLERIGKIEMELTKLNSFNFNLWEEARKNLTAMGGDAVDSLILKTILIFKRRSALHWDWAKVLLKSIGQPVVPYLVGFIENPSAAQSLRDQCAETLVFMGKVGEAETIKGVSSSTPYIRKAYAFGLGVSRAALSTELLRKLACDTDWEIRGVAIQSLSRLGGPDVVPTLIAALQDSAPIVQYKAAQGLESAKDKRAIGPLINLLKCTPRSQDVELIRVDMAAAKALRATTGQQFGMDPAAWEQWYRKNR